MTKTARPISHFAKSRKPVATVRQAVKAYGGVRAMAKALNTAPSSFICDGGLSGSATAPLACISASKNAVTALRPNSSA